MEADALLTQGMTLNAHYQGVEAQASLGGGVQVGAPPYQVVLGLLRRKYRLSAADETEIWARLALMASTQQEFQRRKAGPRAVAQHRDSAA